MQGEQPRVEVLRRLMVPLDSADRKNGLLGVGTCNLGSFLAKVFIFNGLIGGVMVRWQILTL